MVGSTITKVLCMHCGKRIRAVSLQVGMMSTRPVVPIAVKYKIICISLPAGDVVGPGFIEDYLDAETTLHKPFGSGEQNAYNFAYTLYNLLYLKFSNQLQLDKLDRALYHLNIGTSRLCAI